MSQSRGHVINTRMALAKAQKGTSTIVEFFSCMMSLADDMAFARKKLEGEVIASYIVASLDADINPVVSAMPAHTEPLSLGELYTQLVSGSRTCMDQLHGGRPSATECKHYHIVAIHGLFSVKSMYKYLVNNGIKVT